MGGVSVGGEVQMSGGAWGDGPSGVYMGDLAAAFPDVFAASHAPGSLDDHVADDLVAAVDHRGRRPEDVAFLREFVDGSNGAWTETARRRFDASLFRVHLPQPGLVYFAGSNSHGAIPFPTTEMLLNGRVPAGAFAASLRTVVDVWFDGDLDQVPRPRRVSLDDLRRYLDGEALPADYRGAYAIAGALGVVDPDGLMTAWLADTLRRGQWIEPATLVGDEASTPERGRYLALLGAAIFILDPIPSVLLTGGGAPLTVRAAAEYARAAMQAGFDAETAIGVIAGYAGTDVGFFDEAQQEASALVRVGRADLASTVHWLAAESARREGNHDLAAIEFIVAGELLDVASRNGFVSPEFARHEAQGLYDRALAELELLSESDGARAALQNSIEARMVAISRREATESGNGSSGGGEVGGPPPLEGTPPAPAPAAGASAKAFGGVVEASDAAAAEASAPSALEPEGGDDLMIAAGVSAAGGADIPLVPLAVGAAATPVAR